MPTPSDTNGPRRPGITRWIAGIALVVVTLSLAIGGLALYRAHAIRSFRAALVELDDEGVNKWGLRLAERGWLENVVRDILLDEPTAPSFYDADDAQRLSMTSSPELDARLVPILVRLIDPREPVRVRRRSAWYLLERSMLPDAIVRRALLQNVENLEVALRDPDSETRITTMTAIGQFLPGGPTPVGLVESLSAPEHEVRLAAAHVLFQVEPSRSHLAIPCLTELGGSPDPGIQVSATILLAHVDRNHRSEHLSAVIDALDSEFEVELLWRSFDALAMDGWVPGPHVGRILQLIDHEEGEFLVEDLLKGYIDDTSGPPRVARARVAEALRPLLREDGPGRVFALELLTDLGPDARCAMPELFALLENAEMRDDAEYALSQIDPEIAIENETD